MNILGIETSCDETAIAIVSGECEQLTVKKSIVLSQIQDHAAYGGVVPELAARKHLEAIFPMLQHELPPDGAGIDAISVTAGPGLAPALRIGVEVAKTLAWTWNKPLVPVSHIEGHMYAAWLQENGQTPSFPALALIVSGGHTELVLMKNHGEYERLGETLDDAAGEAFDKVAKMLGLSYPGGPEIAKLAEDGDPHAVDFPRGLLDRPNLDFSFSGVKTSVLYYLRKHEEQLHNHSFRANIAASFQEAVVDVLVRKTMRAAKKHNPTSIILAGGVAANIALRQRLTDIAAKESIPVFLPPFAYSLDNAAMIAAVGYFHAQDKRQHINPVILKHDSNLDII